MLTQRADSLLSRRPMRIDPGAQTPGSKVTSGGFDRGMQQPFIIVLHPAAWASRSL